MSLEPNRLRRKRSSGKDSLISLSSTEYSGSRNEEFLTFDFVKPTLCFLFLLGFVQCCQAQCNVSLGDDIHVCQTWEATSFPVTALGSDLVIANATAPFTYQWSMEPISYFSTTFHASGFLDDTTSANPAVLEIWEDSLTFFLKVEDANEQMCYDTIIVSTSLFNTHLGNLTFYINEGDSVLLFGGPNVASNYPTDSLAWRPSIGLSDSTAATPMASPPTNQNYRSVIWDSQGCEQEGSASQFVIVTPVGIKEESKESLVYVYSNQHELILDVHEDLLPYTFRLWDSQGRSIIEKQIAHSSERILTDLLKTGVYLYSVKGRNGLVKTDKLILN